MSNSEYQLMTAVLAAAGPVLLLAMGLRPAAAAPAEARRAAAAGAGLALAGFGAALLAAAGLGLGGVADEKICLRGPFFLGVYFDRLTAILLALVTFLQFTVAQFSRQYLAGDPGQGRFTRWLCLTGGAVQMILISGNLLQLAAAWSATSLCLHQLLMFYADRPGARLAARKKFIISRLGDACLLAVIGLVYARFHTWNFSALFAAAAQMREADPGGADLALSAIGFLLVAGAMLKSAQFPFHSWLPDTLETPTPVSALMHAGIINAGGFLIIRLSPLADFSPLALSWLALTGAFTALFASLVMLTHASIKRALAFSTVAQMGFMMLECGLGAYPLAVLHLVAHSLYKAHAFLSSGDIVRLAHEAWTPGGRPAARPGTLVVCLLTGTGLTFAVAGCFGIHLLADLRQLVLGATFAMAMAYLFWNLWGRDPSVRKFGFGLLIASGLCAAQFFLHRMFAGLIPPSPLAPLAGAPRFELAAMVLIIGLFLAVLVIQTELPAWAERPFFQRLYVHARNGFYFNTLANRCVTALWPASPAKKL